jgi:hypothetical protein
MTSLFTPEVAMNSKTSIRHYLKILTLATSVIFLAACAAAVPVTADVAGAALEKSGDLAKAGKAETHQPIGIDAMAGITEQAAGELSLRQTGREVHAGKIKLKYRDQRHQDIAVTLTRRTPVVTQLQVDVGWFGDAGMGELLLRQIMHDMPPEAARHVQSATDGGTTRGD